MQIKPHQYTGFRHQEHKSFKAVLFHGEDSYLTYGKLENFVTQGLKESYKDLRFIPADEFTKGHQFLSDALLSPGLFQHTTLMIQNVQDNFVPLLQTLLESDHEMPFFIMVSETYLKTSLKLRKFFEDHPKLAIVPCYLPNARDISQDIINYCSTHHKKISPSAVHKLASILEDAPALVTQELDKLILYVGYESEITEDHIHQISIDYGQVEMDDLADAILSRKGPVIIEKFQRLNFQSGTEILFLRGFSHKIVRLQQAHFYKSENMPLDQIYKKVWPPLYGQDQLKFNQQLQAWSYPTLQKVLTLLLEAEIFIKENNVMASEYALNTLLKIIEI